MVISKTIRRKKAQLRRYLKETDPGYGLTSKELTQINKKVAHRIAKKRSGLRGRR